MIHIWIENQIVASRSKLVTNYYEMNKRGKNLIDE